MCVQWNLSIKDTVLVCVQWNLSVKDTLETAKGYATNRFPLFSSYNYPNQQKESVRNRFLLLKEVVIRGGCYRGRLL